MAPYICGTAAGEAPLFPGETWRGVMEVDRDICGDDAVFSTVSMLSELNFVFALLSFTVHSLAHGHGDKMYYHMGYFGEHCE